MISYKAWEEKRRKRQVIMTLLFLLFLIGGWFWPLLGYLVPFCMILGLLLAVFRGRKWCDWMCPRGSFYDILVKHISSQRKIPQAFKRNKVKIIVLIFIMLVMLGNLAAGWPDPVKIGRFFVVMLSVTTFLGVVLALFFHQRSWCYLCPVGTIVGNIRRDQRLKIKSSLCSECELCLGVCPVNLRPMDSKDKKEKDLEQNNCVRCDLCLKICPKNALYR